MHGSNIISVKKLKHRPAMFSKLLIRLIDQAIVPAIVLLAARIIAVVFISNYYGYQYTLDLNGLTFSDTQQYVQLNSYSTLVMAGMLTVGLTYIMIKALVFHDSHIKPSVSAKLFSFKMHHLIQSSYGLYTQGAIWLSYLFLLTLVAAVMALGGLMYGWVVAVLSIVTVVSTVLFILDVEYEIAINKAEFEDIGFVHVEEELV
jgi:uncharacterized membrane protein